MDTELLMKLKKAGFPFRHGSVNDDTLYEVGKPPLAIPTLSELIEACGDKFTTLIRWKNEYQAEKGLWRAIGRSEWKKEKPLNELVKATEFSDYDINFHEIGKKYLCSYIGEAGTPEEAVALLFLSLNQKTTH